MESKKRVYEDGQRRSKIKSKGAKRRARKAAAEEEEERGLTSLLFGGADLHSVSAGREYEQQEKGLPTEEALTYLCLFVWPTWYFTFP